MKINAINNTNFGRCNLKNPNKILEVIKSNLPKCEADTLSREVDGLIAHINQRSKKSDSYFVSLKNFTANAPDKPYQYGITIKKKGTSLDSGKIPYAPPLSQDAKTFDYQESSKKLTEEVQKLKDTFQSHFEGK